MAIGPDERQQSIWDLFVTWMQANCDFGHAVSQMHAPLFQMCYDVLRKLKKDHPEYVVPIISMLFPTITPMGASLFAKAGLGTRL